MARQIPPTGARLARMRAHFLATLDRRCTIRLQDETTGQQQTSVPCSISSKAGNAEQVGIGSFTMSFQFGTRLAPGGDVLIAATAEKPATRMSLVAPLGDALVGERWTAQSSPNYGTA